MMKTPSEKLAQSLLALKALQDQGMFAIPAKQLSRIHRERLCKNGFLEEVLKGWYIPIRPDEVQGDSTAWYASFWNFCASYFNNRFDDDWCLSPEQSLLIHAENWTVPRQLFVRSSKGRNKVTQLLHNTSFFDARYNMPDSQHIEKRNGVRIFSLAAALVSCSPKFFTQYPIDARAVLFMIRDSSEILRILLEGGHTTVAGRLCGAFRSIGYNRIADDIKKTMLVADFDVRENDPFITEKPFLLENYERSPYVTRLNVMWQEMRQQVIQNFFHPSPGVPIDIEAYLKSVDENYLTDAYHSLSIEGYQVTLDLIEKVRSGKWNPDAFENDRNQKNALAARGYWQAFNAVKESLKKVLKGANAGETVELDHGNWYRELFQPSVIAGILKPSDLAGYRNNSVFIRRSMHVPPRAEIVSDLMEVFFKRLSEEKEVSVRIVLGHFFFVYIHPYMDGNGRIGRFLMNVMFASGGYSWTIIPVERRNEYMEALEEASVNQNIVPFCKFLARCLA